MLTLEVRVVLTVTAHILQLTCSRGQEQAHSEQQASGVAVLEGLTQLPSLALSGRSQPPHCSLLWVDGGQDPFFFFKGCNPCLDWASGQFSSLW